MVTSIEVRWLVVKAVQFKTMPRRKILSTYGISLTTYRRIMRLWRRTKDVVPEGKPGHRGPVPNLTDDQKDQLVKLLVDEPQTCSRSTTRTSWPSPARTACTSQRFAGRWQRWASAGSGCAPSRGSATRTRRCSSRLFLSRTSTRASSSFSTRHPRTTTLCGATSATRCAARRLGRAAATCRKSIAAPRSAASTSMAS